MISKSVYGETFVDDEYARHSYINELALSTADSSINLTLVSAVFTNMVTIPIVANDLRILDGRSIKVKLIADFSKSVAANSTLEFQVIIGGITFTFPTFTAGGAIIGVNAQTLEIELDINIRSGNLARVLGRLSRSSNGTNLNWLTFKPLLAGTFDKTIANNISIGARIVATAGNVIIGTQQIQAAL